jgi:hypothetical protein
MRLFQNTAFAFVLVACAAPLDESAPNLVLAPARNTLRIEEERGMQHMQQVDVLLHVDPHILFRPLPRSNFRVDVVSLSKKTSWVLLENVHVSSIDLQFTPDGECLPGPYRASLVLSAADARQVTMVGTDCILVLRVPSETQDNKGGARDNEKKK